MGDYYEIQFLADTPFIVYQNKNTGYQTVCVELTPEQFTLVDRLMRKHDTETTELLKGIIYPTDDTPKQEWPEDGRIEEIGQNGGDGLHYKKKAH